MGQWHRLCRITLIKLVGLAVINNVELNACYPYPWGNVIHVSKLVALFLNSCESSFAMLVVGIVLSSSFNWYNLHGSRMYKTHIKQICRTPFVVSKTWWVKTSLSFFFLKMTENTPRVSGNKAAITGNPVFCVQLHNYTHSYNT